MDQMKKEELEITISDSDRIECAIRHIESSLDVDPWAVEIAVEAMQKQIPKKPTVPVDTWLCPSCGEPVEYQQKLGDNVLYHGQHDFCPKCGQAIDWEGEG